MQFSPNLDNLTIRISIFVLWQIWKAQNKLRFNKLKHTTLQVVREMEILNSIFSVLFKYIVLLYAKCLIFFLIINFSYFIGKY